MDYIRSAAEEPNREAGSCVFCDLPGSDEAARILGNTELAYAVLNKFPYNPGHLLVVPRRHTGDRRQSRSSSPLFGFRARNTCDPSGPSARNPNHTGSTSA